MGAHSAPGICSESHCGRLRNRALTLLGGCNAARRPCYVHATAAAACLGGVLLGGHERKRELQDGAANVDPRDDWIFMMVGRGAVAWPELV